MKEAAGEANMTVITIVLIAIVLGFGTLIINSMMKSNANKSDCTAKGKVFYNGTCYTPDSCSNVSGKMVCN